MPFEKILGNEAALGRLKGLLKSGRLAHAYIFSGPDGVGKKLAALDFARALGAIPAVISRLPERQEILIAQVHEVIRELNLTSDEQRVIIFDEAHRMSEEAMNACLRPSRSPLQRRS